MPYPLCSFTKPDGIPCGSPALRGKPLCYYHHRDDLRQRRAAAAVGKPALHSLRGIQMAITDIVRALGAGTITTRVAGARLYALQQATASINKPKPIAN